MKDELEKHLDVAKNRLGHISKENYYFYVLGYIFCSFLHTYYDIHDRDMMKEDQDETVGIMKERVKREIDEAWTE